MFRFQGSEEKTIVYVLDTGNLQTWKHVYTAVTRGQSRVYVITKRNGLEKAIRGRVINRNTRLKGFVVDLLHDFGFAKNDLLTQLSHSQFNTPKRGSGLQNFHSTLEPFPSPGPSQAYSEGNNCQNLTQPASWFGGQCSARSSPGKRERIPDNCTTPSKQMKVDTPLGCSKLQNLSLQHITPRKLFTKPSQSHQDH